MEKKMTEEKGKDVLEHYLPKHRDVAGIRLKHTACLRLLIDRLYYLTPAQQHGLSSST